MTVPHHVIGLERLDLDGDVLLFDGDMLHRLTGTAVAVYRLLDGATSVDDLVGQLCARHDAPRHTVHPGVAALLQQLAQEGVITFGPPREVSTFMRPAHVAHIRDGDHVLLADLRTGVRSALSASGSLVWELACTGADAEEIVVSAVGHDEPCAAGQVVALLDELCEAGLLTRRT